MNTLFKWIIPLLALLHHTTTGAQPMWGTQTTVAGRLVVKDLHIPNKYYYGPGKLSLTTDASGKPVFQLVSIRYTGTNLTNDFKEKRFTNLLSFGVTMEPVSAATKNLLRKTLQLPAHAELSPLPIRHLSSTVVSGVGKNNHDDRRWLKQTSSEQENDTAPGVFWTERTFTMALDNHEAQILLDQYANGRLAVTLNYTFFANVMKVQDETIEVSGDSVFIETMKDAAEMERDTQQVSEAVLSDALNITIDVAKYPDALKKIDINEQSIPPAYAALEVKCFDFSMGVRPDLTIKTVEIEGTSVVGTPVLIKTRFYKKQPDLTSKHVSFPYAILLDKPIRYRIKESDLDGGSTYSPWKTMEMFSNLIDASTPQDKNPVMQRSVDVEILPDLMAQKNITEVGVHFIYQRHGQREIQTVLFTPDSDTPLKTVELVCDAHSPVQYTVSRRYTDQKKTKGVLRAVPTDNYIWIGQ